DDVNRLFPDSVLRAIRRAAERGARVASICTGAFVLAATGVLDGLRATTHWLAAADLARRHPSIDLDANVLYVDNGRVLTSAGAAPPLRFCLLLICPRPWASGPASAPTAAAPPLAR